MEYKVDGSTSRPRMVDDHDRCKCVKVSSGTGSPR